jgi:hypothetical protein
LRIENLPPFLFWRTKEGETMATLTLAVDATKANDCVGRNPFESLEAVVLFVVSLSRPLLQDTTGGGNSGAEEGRRGEEQRRGGGGEEVWIAFAKVSKRAFSRSLSGGGRAGSSDEDQMIVSSSFIFSLKSTDCTSRLSKRWLWIIVWEKSPWPSERNWRMTKISWRRSRDEDLVTKINDSVESRAVLVKPPQDKSLTLDGFVQMQEMAVKQNSVSLSLSWGDSRGGDRCSDLFHLLCSLPIDLSGVPLVSHDEIVEVEKHFISLTWPDLTSQALLNCARPSFGHIRSRRGPVREQAQESSSMFRSLS